MTVIGNTLAYDFSLYDYEYLIVFQSCGSKYQLTYPDGYVSFEDLREKGEDEAWSRIGEAVLQVLAKIQERGIKHAALLMLMTDTDNENCSEKWWTGKFFSLFFLLGSKDYMDISEDVEFQIFSYCTGKRWNTDDVCNDIRDRISKVKKGNPEEEIRDAIEGAKDFKDPKTKFVEYLNSLYERAALNDKTFKIVTTKEAAVNHWKKQFHVKLYNETNAKDRILRVEKGQFLKKNRILLLLIAFMLKASEEQVKELFEYGDLAYEAETKEEAIFMGLIENGIYEYKEGELREALQNLDYNDIYHLAGFDII
ncbi:MAG: hypothetical protein K6G19_05920 [Lachnospiraceae bacterium]|nr:hypothetical protein [Lachnospiraceae bacterium]